MSFPRRRRAAPSRCEPLESRCLLSATLGDNLVVNGDAEADTGAADADSVVRPTGWTIVENPEVVGVGFTAVQYGASGGLPTSSTPGSPDRGNNFFAGGPFATESGVYQEIDVSKLAAGIDAGLIDVTLSGWLGGFGADKDQMELSMFFQSDPTDEGAQYFAGTVTADARSNTTEFLKHSVDTTVPAGTRFIKVELDATRSDGDYNDAYADDISLSLSTTATTGFVAGTVYNDLNDNRSRESNEPGVRNVTVFIDKNNNKKFDGGELGATTNSHGHYLIANVPEGAAVVRIVDPKKFHDSGPDPAKWENPQTVMVVAGETSTANFSISQSAVIGGTVYEDFNFNNRLDAGDEVLGGVVVYLDYNNNGKLDKREPRVKTNKKGQFSFAVSPQATYVVRAVAPVQTGIALGRPFATPYPLILPKGSRFVLALGTGQLSLKNIFLFQTPIV